MSFVTICFDGGCYPNPGKGYGSFEIRDNNYDVLDCQLKIPFGDNLTSNQCEYLALIAALNKLEILINNPFDLELKIKTDSMLVCNQLNNYWRVKHKNIIPYFEQIMNLLDKYPKWKISWYGRENNVEKFGH